MAIPHFRGRIISGSRSPVSVAAYIHRTAMADNVRGEIFRFAADACLVHSEVAMPANAAPWLANLLKNKDPATQSMLLWNSVAKAENRHDAQTTREFVIAMPIELSQAQNVTLMRDYIEQHLTSRGLVVDWAFHNEPGNPHVHLMHTLRPVVAGGFGKKREALLDDAGQPIRDKKGKIVSTQFIGNSQTLIDLRTAWAETASHHLAMAGHDVVLDLRSYKAQGIKLTPSTHIGPTGTQFARTGKPSTAVDASKETKEITRDQIIADPGRLLDAVSKKMSVFDRRDVAMALHTFVDDPTEFTRILNAALASKRLFVLKDAIGKQTHPGHIPARLATIEQVELEDAMSHNAGVVALRAGLAVPAVAVAHAIANAKGPLSQQQKDAIVHITTGSDLSSVVGFAGAGKTTLLATAVAAWTAQGFEVHGAALANKAAKGLTEGAGIEARSIASWKGAWKFDKRRLTNRDILIVDEAGMVGSDDMAALLAEVKKSGAKLVLIGDPEQLQPISAGGAFRSIMNQSQAFVLDTVYRQNDEWARTATVQFQRDQVEEAMTAYHDHGAFVETKDRAAAVERLVRDYIDASKTSAIPKMIALAHRNDDILAINTAIQEHRFAAGELGPAVAIRTQDGPRFFGTGDRFLMLTNQKDMNGQDVWNSDLGTVKSIDTTGQHPVLTVALDGGKTVKIDAGNPKVNFDLGYATTIHKSQGATVDRSFVLASGTMDKYMAYVAMSRHRVSTQVYVPRSEFKLPNAIPANAEKPKTGIDKDLFKQLVYTFSRTAPKETTLDYASRTAALAKVYGERRGVTPNSSIPIDLQHLVSGGKAVITAMRQRLTDLWELVCKSDIAPRSLRHDATRPPVTKGRKIMDLSTFKHINSKATVDAAGNPGILATWAKDPEANAIAKDMGARWSNDEKAWAFKTSDPRTERAFERIDGRLAALDKSTKLAADVVVPRTEGISSTVINGKLQLQMPKDLTANRMLKSVDGVRWDAKAKAFSVQLIDGDHVYDLNQTLETINVHLGATKEYAPGLAELNEKVPGLNAEISISDRGEVQVTARPQYDRDLITALKTGIGAKWDAADKAWSLPIEPGKVAELAASPHFEGARTRLAALSASADTARNVENQHPLISASRRGAEIVVTLPRDLNANAALKKSGFEWNAAIKSWTVQPKDDAHLQGINNAISRAGAELDKALVPHTPDRPGIPHMNDYYANVIGGGRDAAVTKYSTDRRVRTAIDAIVTGAEAMPDEAKAALKAANEARAASGGSLTSQKVEDFAKALGINSIQAVSAANMINRATDIQTLGIPAQQEVQRLAMESQQQSKTI